MMLPRNKKLLIFIFLGVIIILNVIYPTVFLRYFTKLFPNYLFINTVRNVQNFLQKDAAKLLEENIQLKMTNAILEEQVRKNNFLKKNNFVKNNFIPANIIFRPPAVISDTLVINKGTDDKIKEGMEVVVFDNILIGHVNKTGQTTSYVKLISHIGEETNIIFADSRIPAIAAGIGGENLMISIPSSIKVNIGEAILTIGDSPMLVGFIEKIKTNISDPFQKIFLRLPLNLNYISIVFIKP